MEDKQIKSTNKTTSFNI